ncbi:MAG: hypothetical protein KC933_38545, partial [Myxococcales bacterium]|nr:hypothetical protein [Myxococcales bacterium]
MHVIGVVDQFGSVPELIESNNVFLGELMGFGFGPDLVVTAISAPPSAQSSFDASVTACNQGTDYAGSFDVVLYVSEDDVITTAFPGPSPDFPAAWANFPGLAPGQCQTQAVQANAWGQGAFYLGAVVDESQSMPELIEGNNTFVGGLIGLGNGPDLIVTAVEGPPTADGSFDVQVTTCNQGTDFASGGSVTVYLSVDDVITPPVMPGPYTDFPAAWVPLPGLMPGQCSTDVGTVYGFAWGAYYLGAVADENDTVPELIESNNTFVGEQIGLGSGPDLIVTAVDGPPSADGSFTVQVTACNQGTAPSGSSEVAVYASADQVITSAWSNPYYVDFPVGFMPLPGLSPGQCYSGAVSAWAPPQGAYYLGAYVDESDSQQELLEGNNTFVGALTGFGYGPDLVVTQITAPANADGAFDLTVVACNQGTGPSGGFPVELYVSEDRVIDPYTGYGPPVDFPLAGLYFSGLQPGECASQTTSAWAPVSGEWYLGAYADPQDAEAELIESNNAFIGPRMGFGFGPDLIVTQITAPPSADGQFSLSVRVCNQGTAFAPGADVAVYATEDTTIDTNFPPPIGDFMLTTLPVSGLQPGECQDLTDMAYSGPSGAFYLGAIVDQFQNLQELQEGNNTFVGDLMGFGPGPDMVVSEILAPPSANGPFVATLTVCNQGTTPSFGIDVTLYASEDSVVTPQFNLPYPSPDMFLGQAPVPPLNPGECAGVGVNAYSAGQGAYYLGAV